MEKTDLEKIRDDVNSTPEEKALATEELERLAVKRIDPEYSRLLGYSEDEPKPPTSAPAALAPRPEPPASPAQPEPPAITNTGPERDGDDERNKYLAEGLDLASRIETQIKRCERAIGNKQEGFWLDGLQQRFEAWKLLATSQNLDVEAVFGLRLKHLLPYRPRYLSFHRRPMTYEETLEISLRYQQQHQERSKPQSLDIQPKVCGCLN